jgi:hypothetical protein
MEKLFILIVLSCFSLETSAQWQFMKNCLATTFCSAGSAVYAAGGYDSITNTNLWVLPTGSSTWTGVATDIPTDEGLFSLVKSGSSLYAGTTNGVHISHDNGVTWVNRSNGFSQYVGCFNVNLLGSKLFTCTWMGVYTSTDTGVTWIHEETGLPVNTIGYHSLVSGNDLFIGTTNGLFKYSPTGWINIPVPGMTWSNIHGLYETGGYLIVANDKQIFVSTDKGSNWSQILAGTQIQNITAVGQHILISQGTGAYVADINGSNYTSIGNGSFPLTGVYSMIVHNGFIYAAASSGTNQGIFRIPLSQVITGISYLKDASIQLYPNPTRGKFYITGLERDDHLDVTDIRGLKVYSTTHSSGKITVDLSHRPQGVYFYTITRAGAAVRTGNFVID